MKTNSSVILMLGLTLLTGVVLGVVSTTGVTSLQGDTLSSSQVQTVQQYERLCETKKNQRIRELKDRLNRSKTQFVKRLVRKDILRVQVADCRCFQSNQAALTKLDQLQQQLSLLTDESDIEQQKIAIARVIANEFSEPCPPIGYGFDPHGPYWDVYYDQQKKITEAKERDVVSCSEVQDEIGSVMNRFRNETGIVNRNRMRRELMGLFAELNDRGCPSCADISKLIERNNDFIRFIRQRLRTTVSSSRSLPDQLVESQMGYQNRRLSALLALCTDDSSSNTEERVSEAPAVAPPEKTISQPERVEVPDVRPQDKAQLLPRVSDAPDVAPAPEEESTPSKLENVERLQPSFNRAEDLGGFQFEGEELPSSFRSEF